MNSKKILLFFTITICGLFSLSAQFRVGFKAGGNLSNLYTDMNSVVFDTYKPKVSFHVGAVAEYMFSKHIGLQTELNYINCGAILDGKKFLETMKGLDPSLTMEGNVTMNMIQLPLYLKAKIPLNNKTSVYLLGGGFGSYTVSSEQRMNFVKDAESLKINWDLFGNELYIGNEGVDNIFRQQRFNAGITTEAGIELSDKLGIGIGYRRILTNMSSFSYSNGFTVVMQPNIKLSMATLSLYYFF